MKASINVWGIKEYKGDGLSCPIIPANLPLHKRALLFFFRFGVCPMCITMSLGYNIAKPFKRMMASFKNSKK
ncbi:MAG: hypothetical protein H0U95_14090 [Bacteroidetes bacterium]|nr:hypothetical protein [Bacteroidota bacterium]